jgi:hypothetical protein
MNHVDQCRICEVLRKSGFDAVGKRYRHGHYPDQDWASSSHGEAMYVFCLRAKLPEQRLLAMQCEVVAIALAAAGIEDPRPAAAIEVGLRASKKMPHNPAAWDARYMAWRGCQDFAYECFRKGTFDDDAVEDIPRLRLHCEFALLAGVACFSGMTGDTENIQALRFLVRNAASAYANIGECFIAERDRRKEEYLQLVANKVREIFPWEALQQHLLPASEGPTVVEGWQNERVTMRKPSGEPS